MWVTFSQPPQHVTPEENGGGEMDICIVSLFWLGIHNSFSSALDEKERGQVGPWVYWACQCHSADLRTWHPCLQENRNEWVINIVIEAQKPFNVLGGAAARAFSLVTHQRSFDAEADTPALAEKWFQALSMVVSPTAVAKKTT